jgi:putative FmdB family regulatory protein
LPVYEYRCGSGHQFEKTEGFNAPAEQRCQECGRKARRLLSMPAIIFKGSGFYSTDNRKSSAAGAARSEPSANGHSHDVPAPAGDSKVEAAAD